MPYAWLRVAIDTWFLGLECSNVVALRMIKLAVGGPRAKAESDRMVEEKLAALVALPMAAADRRSWSDWFGNSARFAAALSKDGAATVVGLRDIEDKMPVYH